MTIAKTFQLWRRFLVRRIRRRPLLPFLLAATVAITALVAFIGNDWDWSLATVVAEVGLLGLWMGQWRRGWLLRIVLASAGVVVATLALSVYFHPPFTEILTVFGIYAVGVATLRVSVLGVGWAIARMRGLPTEDVRFSMATMLAALTATACLAATVRLLDIPNDDPVELTLGFGSWALLPLGSYEVVRRVRRIWIAILGVAGLSLVSAIAFLLAIGPRSDDLFFPTLWQGIFIGAWLIGLRSRNRPIERTQNETSPALRIAERPSEEPVAAAQPGGIDLEA